MCMWVYSNWKPHYYVKRQLDPEICKRQDEWPIGRDNRDEGQINMKISKKPDDVGMSFD